MYCCDCPGFRVTVAGVSAIDTKGLVMVRTAEFETIFPCVAVIVEVVFGVTPVASPD